MARVGARSLVAVAVMSAEGYGTGVGPSGGEDYLFLYLSYEHPFTH